MIHLRTPIAAGRPAVTVAGDPADQTSAVVVIVLGVVALLGFALLYERYEWWLT